MQHFCLGTYTEPILFGTGEVFQGKGKGIYICSFDAGKIGIKTMLPLRNPSFLCLDEERGKIYTVNEMKEYERQFGGGISEVSYGGNGELRLERSFCTGGADPCHIALAPDKKCVAVANFASGSVSAFPLLPDGSLTGERQLFSHTGSSVHPVRQRGPHAHSVIFTGGGGLLVPDLGTDQVVAYCYEGGEVRPDPQRTLAVKSGNGPRYGEFSPDRKHFYLINEIGSSVTHFLVDKDVLTERETVSTLPGAFEGGNICSDLHITPDGKNLFASNRGHDSLAVFAIGAEGALSALEHVPCGGRTPRSFVVDHTGCYVLVGNQDSDLITTFEIQGGGHLQMISQTNCPSPVCLKFFTSSL